MCFGNNKSNLNTNECSRTDDLFNRNGQYLKSLCTVSKDLNYNQAKQACENNGMSLFILTSEDVQKAFFKAAEGRFADRGYSRLWINGRKDGADNWFTEGSSYHLTNVDWYNGKNNEGECLSVVKYQNREQIKASGWDCSRIAWGYCEYINLEIFECFCLDPRSNM